MKKYKKYIILAALMALALAPQHIQIMVLAAGFIFIAAIVLFVAGLALFIWYYETRN